MFALFSVGALLVYEENCEIIYLNIKAHTKTQNTTWTSHEVGGGGGEREAIHEGKKIS